MKRGLLDRIDRCCHVAVCHAHANGVTGLKGLGARGHPIIAVRDGITTGKHLERRQGIERGCRTAQVGCWLVEHRAPLMLQAGFGLSAFHSGLLTFAAAMGALTMKLTAAPILRRLGFVCRIGEHDISVSVSIGIAMAPDDGTDFATLSKCAEIAMYRAKQEGRNTLRFFFPEMQERTLRHVQLTGALRGAVERGEMQLHYQPQVDLQTGELSGVEALLR